MDSIENCDTAPEDVFWGWLIGLVLSLFFWAPLVYLMFILIRWLICSA